MGSGWNKSNRGLWASDEPKSSLWSLVAFLVVLAVLIGVVYYLFGHAKTIGP